MITLSAGPEAGRSAASRSDDTPDTINDVVLVLFLERGKKRQREEASGRERPPRFLRRRWTGARRGQCERRGTSQGQERRAVKWSQASGDRRRTTKRPH